jgi:hypothetical protein
MENVVHPVCLGWAAVACRDEEQREKGRSIEEAIAIEEDLMRSQEPWKSLCPSSQIVGDIPSLILGVPHLRKALSELLEYQISANMGSVRAEIKVLLNKTQEKLNCLGTEFLSSQDQQHDMMTKLAELYSILEAGANGHYDANDFFDGSDDAHWRAHVANELDKFYEQISNISGKYVNRFDEFNEFGNPVNAQASEEESRERNQRIGRKICAFRGSELPGFQSHPLLVSIFKEEVFRFWDGALKMTMENIHALTQKFLRKATEHVCRNTGNNRLRDFFRDLCDREDALQWKILEEKLNDEKEKARDPFTLDGDFFNRVRKMRAVKLHHVWKTKVFLTFIFLTELMFPILTLC